MTPHPRVQDLYDGLLWSIDLAQSGGGLMVCSLIFVQSLASYCGSGVLKFVALQTG